MRRLLVLAFLLGLTGCSANCASMLTPCGARPVSSFSWGTYNLNVTR